MIIIDPRISRMLPPISVSRLNGISSSRLHISCPHMTIDLKLDISPRSPSPKGHEYDCWLHHLRWPAFPIPHSHFLRFASCDHSHSTMTEDRPPLIDSPYVAVGTKERGGEHQLVDLVSLNYHLINPSRREKATWFSFYTSFVTHGGTHCLSSILLKLSLMAAIRPTDQMKRDINCQHVCTEILVR